MPWKYVSPQPVGRVSRIQIASAPPQLLNPRVSGRQIAPGTRSSIASVGPGHGRRTCAPNAKNGRPCIWKTDMPNAGSATRSGSVAGSGDETVGARVRELLAFVEIGVRRQDGHGPPSAAVTVTPTTTDAE